MFPPINQIGIVVKDAEKAAEYYSSTFGIGPFTIYDTNLQRATLYGESSPSRLKMAIAQGGVMEIELIQVLEGGEFYTDFLHNKGEGLHHAGSYTDNFDSYNRILAEMIRQGINPSFQYGGKSLSFTYFDTQAIGGVILELIYLKQEG